MNLHSKNGYAYDTFMTVELAVKAVENACMKARHIIHSFGWRENLNNNACIESFHSLLIKEKKPPNIH